MTRLPTDPDSIRALAAVMAETGLIEVEIAEKDCRIRVVRAGVQVDAAAIPISEPRAQPVASPSVTPSSAVENDLSAHPGAVTSPMVGVAYLAPEPGAPYFVSVGQSVVAGQTLLLIEAMKTFNQIKAPKAATVAQILVQNSAPVEYGEVLIVLE